MTLATFYFWLCVVAFACAAIWFAVLSVGLARVLRALFGGPPSDATRHDLTRWH